MQTVNVPMYFLSAKSGDGVERMFTEICQTLIANNKMRKPKWEGQLERHNNHKSKCCGK